MTSSGAQSIVQLDSDTPLGNRILKVNHAGEHGAVCIYTSQILVARFTAPSLVVASIGAAA